MTHRLLFVIGALDRGGTERHLVQLLPRLPRDRFRPMVYTLRHKGVLAPVLEAAGIPVIAPPTWCFGAGPARSAGAACCSSSPWSG